MTTRPPTTPTWERTLARLHIDVRGSQPGPSAVRVLLATVVAIAGSLVADTLLVHLGQHLYPRVRHYGHFRFSDYAKLTVIGVLVACAGWPLVARFSSAPRLVFGWLAVLVTVVLFAPDAYIYVVQKQPGEGVFVLIWLHVAIAIVTYAALVTIAPPRTSATHGGVHTRPLARP